MGLNVLDSYDMEIKVLDKIPSSIDSTIKYVFISPLNNNIIEASYINKDDGKNIICVSSQTSCNLRCKFCHTTDFIGKIKVNNLLEREITNSIFYINKDLNLEKTNKPLLVSFMGCGEPVLNFFEVYYSMKRLHKVIPNSRFAMATILPKTDWIGFFHISAWIKSNNIPLKVHLSLHFVDDIIRGEWMPFATDIKTSIATLLWYKHFTGNPVEIHYTLINGVNDSSFHINILKDLLFNQDIPIKFLQFNKKESLDYVSSNNIDDILNFMMYNGIEAEYYDPPGKDVGSSCGMLSLNYYLKYLKK